MHFCGCFKGEDILQTITLFTPLLTQVNNARICMQQTMDADNTFLCILGISSQANGTKSTSFLTRKKRSGLSTLVSRRYFWHFKGSDT